MFENIKKFFKKVGKKEKTNTNSRDTAKERLHLVLMQDRANVSADFLDLMRQEIIEVIKKYIDIDESALDVRLTNQAKEDGTQGAPVLYANIPIINIKEDGKKVNKEENENNNQIGSKEEGKHAQVEFEKNNSEEETANVENNSEISENETEEIQEQNQKESQEENIAEEKVDEVNIEGEITKQEEEKIEEAIKIVEEESSTVDSSNIDLKED